jgi:hypothetical protein
MKIIKVVVYRTQITVPIFLNSLALCSNVSVGDYACSLFELQQCQMKPRYINQVLSCPNLVMVLSPYGLDEWHCLSIVGKWDDRWAVLSLSTSKNSIEHD